MLRLTYSGGKRRPMDSQPWQPGRFITDTGWTTSSIKRTSPLKPVVSHADAAILKMMGK